jgi:adenylate kinase family enzyme
MKKVIVIGCPGSGKSTFSRKLHEVSALPLFHLDLMYWNEDKSVVDKAVFIDRLERTLELDEWIIDGNYSSTMRLRMDACDTVIFLDYKAEICLDGVKARRGKERSDMPWVETEEDAEFIAFIKGFEKEQRPKILELIEEYEGKKRFFTFKCREEAENFLFRF